MRSFALFAAACVFAVLHTVYSSWWTLTALLVISALVALDAVSLHLRASKPTVHPIPDPYRRSR